MGILKNAADLVYTFRFLKLLTTPFEKTKAYQHGIIDDRGNKIKSFSLATVANRQAYASHYTSFHRLVYNIKKLLAKLPGGGSSLATYASALYLIKEQHSISEKNIADCLIECGVHPVDFLVESNQWFVLSDGNLSPGTYRVKTDKVINESCEELVRSKDQVRVVMNKNAPVGEVFGIPIFEAIHVKTGKSVYVTVDELIK